MRVTLDTEVRENVGLVDNTELCNRIAAAVEWGRQIAEMLLDVARKLMELVKSVFDSVLECVDEATVFWERLVLAEQLCEWKMPRRLAVRIAETLPRAWVQWSVRLL